MIVNKRIYLSRSFFKNTLFLTSLFDNLRELSIEISSFICDEELSTGVFGVVNDISTLFFLFIGLRDGKGGGISSIVDCIEGVTCRLFFLCEGDDDDVDFVGINKDFDD
jgi:hypothetical protein